MIFCYVNELYLSMSIKCLLRNTLHIGVSYMI